MPQVTDNFNRANGALGANWAVNEGAMWNVVSNEAQPTVASQRNAVYWSANTFANDQWASKVYRAGVATNNWFGPSVRNTLANGYYNANVNGPDIELWIRDYAVGHTVLLTTPYAISNGDVVKIEAVGTTIKVYVNDVEQLSVVNTVLTAGSPGLYAYYNLGNVPAIDDFIGSDVFAGAAPTITGEPATSARGETGLILTGTNFGATQGASTLVINGNTIVPTAWTDTQLTYNMPTTFVGLYSPTGYVATVTTVNGNDSSALIPFTPASGRSYIDLVGPLYANDGYMLFGYTGTPAPVATDQLEYDTVTPESSIANTPGADSEWILASMPIVDQTTVCQIIRAATGIRSVDWTITWSVIIALVTGNMMDAILSITGGPTINDGLLTFYKANGATSDSLSDAEREFLIARGIAAGHRSDMWYSFLIGLGSMSLSGDINDMKREWWVNSAPLI